MRHTTAGGEYKTGRRCIWLYVASHNYCRIIFRDEEWKFTEGYLNAKNYQSNTKPLIDRESIFRSLNVSPSKEDQGQKANYTI